MGEAAMTTKGGNFIMRTIRILAIAFPAALTSVLFSGCGGEKKSPPPPDKPIEAEQAEQYYLGQTAEEPTSSSTNEATKVSND